LDEAKSKANAPKADDVDDTTALDAAEVRAEA
jgi:hypothetical protein